MRFVVTITSGLLALTACGERQPQSSANRAVSAETAPDAVQQRVLAMPDAQRNAVLIRAIRDAGLECQNVEASTRQADAGDGSPTWLAQCAAGRGYVVAVGRNGNVNVVPAAPGGGQ